MPPPATPPYTCGNARRRLAVRDSTHLNGIDFLEVSSTDQRELEVHFLKPLDPGLTAANVVIEGGVRTRNLEVTDTEVAGEVLRVTVSEAGDFSTYTLRLVNSASDTAPPPGYDVLLSAVDFSFKANCPSDFDCRPPAVAPPPPPTGPRINYLAKDYASFRRLMLDRLSVLMPHWKERNVADLQITLVELLAYAGDHLSYYQDAVATEAYLFTARRRTSLRRHARLLDYFVHAGTNARAWVHLAVGAGTSLDGEVLPSGTPLLTRAGHAQAALTPDALEPALKEPDVRVFETMHDVTLHAAHNELYFYTWENTDCSLPPGSTSATLRADTSLHLRPEGGDVLVFEEVRDPATGSEADADPRHRHAVRLTAALPGVDELNGQAVLHLRWGVEDALPFSLRLSGMSQGIQLHDISVARGNMVAADHGRTVADEPVVPPIFTGQGRYRPRLAAAGITVAEPSGVAGVAASRLGVQSPRKAVPVIRLAADGATWSARRDLLGSNRFAHEFVPEIREDGRVDLRFGDDVLGRAPGPGFRPLATYRSGSGAGGNVGAEAIGRAVTPRAGLLRVRNPLAATGGTDPESAEAVRQFAPEAFRGQERAVTAEDYAEKARLHPAVQNAVAEFRWTGSWYTVFLTVDRYDGLAISPAFAEQLRAHLERYRLAGYDLEVRPPVLVPLDIALNVCVAPGFFREHVTAALLGVFGRGILPDGQPGFFHPDNFTFGQPVYLSAIYERALRVPGVTSVEAARFRRWARRSSGELQRGTLGTAFNEIARLDNDPNFPENGRITFDPFGGA